jgi:hypothetical protein
VNIAPSDFQYKASKLGRLEESSRKGYARKVEAKPFARNYPLVNVYIAIENGHRNSEFSH